MSRKKANDELLWRAHRERGDERALDELIRRHWPQAFRLAAHCLGDADVAQDVAQDVFVQVAKADATFEEEGDFVAWLRTLVYNAVRMHVRGRDRRRRREIVAADRARASQAPEGEREVEAAEVREHVRRLPLELRFAVILRYFEGRPHKEVALALGCPQGTASSRIRRGLEQLRESLATGGLCVGAPALKTLLREPVELAVPPAPSAQSLLQAAAETGSGAALKIGAAALALLVLLAGAFGLASGPVPEVDPAALGAVDPLPQAADPGDPQRPADNAAAAPDGDGLQDADAAPAPADEAPAVDEEPLADDAEDAVEDVPAQPAVKAPTREEQDAWRKRTVVATGRVLHGQTNQPLANVTVFAAPFYERVGGSSTSGSTRTVTDGTGSFRLSLELGMSGDSKLGGVTLVTQAAGFVPFVRTLSLDELSGALDLLVNPGESALVRGKVVNEDGTPLGGVALALVVHAATRENGAVVGHPAAEPRVHESSLSLTANSAPDGSFALGGLLAGEAAVTVTSRGYANDTQKGVVGVDPPELRVVARKGARVTVETLTAQGAPTFANVSIKKAGQRFGGSRSTRSRSGKVSFGGMQPGDYTVEVIFSDRRGRRIPDEVRSVTLETANPQRLVVRDVDASLRGTVTCEVVDGEEKPQAGVKVWLARAGSDWFGHEEVVTDAAGLAVFSALRHGSYKVQASEELSGHAGTALSLKAAEERLRLTVGSRLPIAGLVVDSAGRPVPGAEVTIFAVGGGSGTSAATNEQGEFVFTPYPKGYVSANVDAEGFSRFSEMRKHDGKPWRLTLAAGRTLTVKGRVAVPDGTAVRLALESDMGSQSGNGKVVTGRFEVSFAGLSPDFVGTLQVRVGEALPSEHPVAAGQVDLDLGAVQPAAGHTVRGRVKGPPGWIGNPDALSPGSVSVSKFHMLYDTKLERDGTFVLEGCPAEPFDLHVFVSNPNPGEDGFKSKTVRVDPIGTPDVGEIDVTQGGEADLPEFEMPSDFDSLKVSVTNPSGVLGTLGFKDGDLIVGLDGVAFENPIQMQQVFTQAFGQPPEIKRGPVKFSVLRGNERLTLEITDYMGQVMAAPEQAGGMAMPHKR